MMESDLRWAMVGVSAWGRACVRAPHEEVDIPTICLMGTPLNIYNTNNVASLPTSISMTLRCESLQSTVDNNGYFEKSLANPLFKLGLARLRCSMVGWPLVPAG